ncbi:MAG: hypothetical protein KDA83_15470 [Planctomycetales bacterium]|nr:hypothetical protein [Planctomycetales bacterium]
MKPNLFQFSLRQILWIVFFISLLVGGVAQFVETYTRPPLAVRSLINEGFTVEWTEAHGQGDSLWTPNRNENIAELRIWGDSDLSVLESHASTLTSIRILAIENKSSSPIGLGFLSKLTTLEMVLLDIPSLTDVSDLKGLENVNSVLLSCPVNDLAPFEDLRRLRWLTLVNANHVDLKGLVRLELLDTFYADGTFSNTRVLEHHPRLRTLRLTDSDSDQGATTTTYEDLLYLAAARPGTNLYHNGQQVRVGAVQNDARYKTTEHGFDR